MYSQSIAVLWEFWIRSRLWIIGAVVWFLAISSMSYVLSDGVVFGFNLLIDKRVGSALLPMGVIPGIFIMFPIFAYACCADISGRDATFPTEKFTLPMTTRGLVGWPMLHGTVIVALGWLLAASLVLRPAGLNVPMWWPAFFLAGCLAWVQAVAWRPFCLPGLRIVAAALTVSVLIVVSSLRWMGNFPEPVVSLLLACTIPPAYVTAVAGVSRVRRGEQPDLLERLSARARGVGDGFRRSVRTFASPLSAQVWFECRRDMLPSLVITCLAILFCLMLIITAYHNPRHSVSVSAWFTISLLCVPFFVAMSTGNGWGMSGFSRNEQAVPIPAFLATRPMTSAGLVWAKMKAGAVVTLFVWGITLVAFALIILFTGAWKELASQISVATRDFSSAQKGVMVPLGIVLLLAGPWRVMVNKLFFTLTGRNWVWVWGAMVITFPVVAVIPFGSWLVLHPEYHANLMAAVPWVLELAAVMKLLLGGWLVSVIMRRHLVQARLAVRLLVAWMLTTAGLAGLLCWLVPTGLASWHVVSACAVLVMPLTRISLAPIALAWNRHR